MISVVVPTYNEEDYIEATLKGVCSQETEAELIVVDGGSDDNTVDIARRYADTVLEMGRGVSKARNAGAESSDGDVILFLDADTVPEPGFFAEMQDAFDDGAIGVCGNVSSTGPLSSKVIYKAVSGIAMITSLIGIPLFYGMCVAWRRDVFQDIGGFNEDIHVGEDMRLSLDLHNMGECRWVCGARAVTSDRRIRGHELIRTLRLHLKNFLKLIFMKDSDNFYPVVR